MPQRPEPGGNKYHVEIAIEGDYLRWALEIATLSGPVSIISAPLSGCTSMRTCSQACRRRSGRGDEMDETKLNFMQLRARALAMAIRGHFRAASEGDAEVLEALASNCLSDLKELSDAPATVRV